MTKNRKPKHVVSLWLIQLLICGLACLTFAAPMNGELITFKQPDGTVIQLQVFGDEYYAETRTLDGYTVIFDSASKTYFYAVVSTDGNEFESSGIMVDSGIAPTGIPKKLTITQQSKKLKIQQRIDADESEKERAKRWQGIKESNRQKREKKLQQQSATTNEISAVEEGELLAEMSAGIALAPPSNETTGTRIGLTIMVEFPDEAGTISPSEVDDYCNKIGYTGFENSGSIFDYFYAQSDGKLRYYNVVTPYVMAPHPKSYYDDTSIGAGDCGRLLLNDVLQELIASGFDFSHCTVNASGRLDAINVFFAGANSGVWSKGLWPHKWGLNPDVDLGGGIYGDQYQITNLGGSLSLGTFCHENGHLLCSFPDFYDYDGDSRGVGRYSLMASSGYGTHPTSVDGYLAYHAGWRELIDITSANAWRGAVRADSGSLYQFVNSTNSAEYFLLENRVKIGWEAGSYLPDQGLNIMHCDENGDHNKQEMTEAEHYEVSIEQADGLFHLENDINSGGVGDLFHAGDVDVFNDSTLPNAHWWANAVSNDPSSGTASGFHVHSIGSTGETMTFVVGAELPSGSAALGVDRTILYASAFSGASPESQKIALWNTAGGTLSYTVSSTNSWINLSSEVGTASTESDIITISFNTASLASGDYLGEITVSNSGNPADVYTVSVELTIEDEPLLSVSTTPITLTGLVNSVSFETILMVDNTGGSEMLFSLSGPSWLSASSTNGVVTGESDAISIRFNAAGLSEGSYNGTLTVSAAGNSPASIPLTFVVLEEITLNNPLSGSFVNGESVTIDWSSSLEAFPSVDVELWLAGSLVEVIADNTPNDGSYVWIIPGERASASNYTIRVSVEGGSEFKESGPLGIWYYQNSFDGSLGDWVNRVDDGIDWTILSGKTATGSTGPNGASDGTHYIYTETSGSGNQTKTAVVSNRFSLGSYPDVNLIFDYHMHGNNMGSLHLDIFDGTAWYLDVWSKTGEQHTSESDPWKTVMVNLSPYRIGPNTDIQFRAITGDGFRSDMAVDNVRLGFQYEWILTNNVPALWMTDYGLIASEAMALLDSDGDGLTNWEEYFAGTSPADPSSVMEMKEVANDPSGLVVSWSAKLGKQYSILYRDNLQTGDWAVAESGILGIEPLCTYTSAMGNATGYIKVEVEH